jgi:cell division protein FtsI (penicillin-binding protein 3)
LNVSEIIAFSSNIGAAKIGQRLGYERFRLYLDRLGFGARTDVGLLGERPGYVRPTAEARPIEQVTAFFGQGLTATSLQLACAMAAIANGGELMRPYVIKRVVDGSGNVIEEGVPRVVRRAVSRRTAEAVTKILKRVVSEEGTGAVAAVPGFAAAGKTGTAQKVDPETKGYSRTKRVATFLGFAPSEDPRVVIQVTIDEPQGVVYGGLVAGPVFSQLGLWCMNYLRVNPEPRDAQKGPEPKTVEEAKNAPPQPVVQPPGGMPDFRGLAMRDVLTGATALGVKVTMEGTGFAYQQEPTPGFPLARVKAVKVRFRPPA